MDERWLPIPGFGGHYEASSLGRIRVKARMVTRHHNGKPNLVPMKAKIRPAFKATLSGHLKLAIGVDGVAHKKFVHELVLLAFVGPRPAGLQGCHRNNQPWDNRPENLRWDTAAGNMSDRVYPSKQVYPVGAAHPMAKLTDELVREIKARQASIAKTAEAFGVSKTTIKRIRSGKSWGHVSCP